MATEKSTEKSAENKNAAKKQAKPHPLDLAKGHIRNAKRELKEALKQVADTTTQKAVTKLEAAEEWIKKAPRVLLGDEDTDGTAAD